MPQTARRHRWAKATTNYLAPTYPTSGNVVLVEFGEYQFTPPQSVNQTVAPTWVPYTTNPYDPGGFAFAVVPTGGTLPAEGDVVRVDLDDGVWWVRPTSSGTTWPVVTCNLFVDFVNGGGSYIEYNKQGSYYVYDYFGDASDIGFAINTGRATYTDWAFSLTQPGRYMWVMNWLGVDAVYTGLGQKSYTTSTPSAGTSHTHTVSIDNRYTLFGQTWLERQAGGSGAWDNGVANIDTHGVQERWVGKHWHYPDAYTGTEDMGDHATSAVYVETGITANDRFRVTSYVRPDNWCGADQGTDKFKLGTGETYLQLTIIRLGDSATIAYS